CAVAGGPPTAGSVPVGSGGCPAAAPLSSSPPNHRPQRDWLGTVPALDLFHPFAQDQPLGAVLDHQIDQPEILIKVEVGSRPVDVIPTAPPHQYRLTGVSQQRREP